MLRWCGAAPTSAHGLALGSHRAGRAAWHRRRRPRPAPAGADTATGPVVKPAVQHGTLATACPSPPTARADPTRAGAGAGLRSNHAPRVAKLRRHRRAERAAGVGRNLPRRPPAARSAPTTTCKPPTSPTPSLPRTAPSSAAHGPPTTSGRASGRRATSSSATPSSSSIAMLGAGSSAASVSPASTVKRKTPPPRSPRATSASPSPTRATPTQSWQLYDFDISKQAVLRRLPEVRHLA